MFILPAALTQDGSFSSSLKNFLKTLANLCGDKPQCWAGRAFIAADLSLSVRSVSRLTAEAVELGLISVRRRYMRSSIITMLCLEERKPKAKKDSNINSVPGVAHRQAHPKNQPFQPFFPMGFDEEKKQRVLEIERVTGDAKSRGCFVKLVRDCPDSAIYVALSSTKYAVETQSGIHAPKYFMGCIRNLTAPANPVMEPAAYGSVSPEPVLKPYQCPAQPLQPPLSVAENLGFLQQMREVLRM